MMVPDIYVLGCLGYKKKMSCSGWSSGSGTALCLLLLYSFWGVLFAMR